MDSVNEDCLMAIMDNMQLKDQIYFAKRNIGLRKILGKRMKFFKITEDTELSREDIKMILKLGQRSLEKITINYSYKGYTNLLDFIVKLDLRNLVELDLECFTLDDNHMEMISRKCKKLKILKIKLGKLTGIYISKMKQLKKLVLRFTWIDGFYLKEIVNELSLEKLTFQQHWTNSDVLMEVPPMKTIKYLKLGVTQFYGILLLEKHPITTLAVPQMTKYSTKNEPLCPPSELKKARKGLRKISLYVFKSFYTLNYLAGYFNSGLTRANILGLTFSQAALHLIDACAKLECIETIFHSNNFYLHDILPMVQALKVRKRKFKLMFVLTEPSQENPQLFDNYTLVIFKEHLRECPVYTNQEFLSIDFKLDTTFIDYLKYTMCDDDET